MAESAVVKRGVVVRNRLGLHARPAALFVQIANKYEAEILVAKGRQTVNGKSIMGIMMLAAQRGSRILITARGSDAERAIAELVELVSVEEF